MIGLKVFLAFASLLQFSFSYNPCVPRPGTNGFVCVCNSTYCDTVPPLQQLISGQYQLYSTSQNKPGFSSSTPKFLNKGNSAEVNFITIQNLQAADRHILGFGGAFTDSTGINILSLPEGAQENLLNSYYGKDGIEYTFGRVPISGTDYSVRAYTYCDEQDDTLEKFALQEEDLKYKIPIIKRAEAIRGQKLNLFASSWSAPKWMKTNNDLIGKGQLKPEYFDLWATYYLKFFESYEKENVSFWGVTTQNEPYFGMTGETFNSMGFTAEDMNKWVGQHLGPRVRASNFSDLKIILHDDFRSNLVGLISDTLTNPDVQKYADGVGVHWYTDFESPASILQDLQKAAPNLFYLATEACICKHAIKQTKEGKASGHDDLPVELLKLVDDDTMQILVNLFNAIYTTGTKPKDWLMSTFITLPKKPNARECSGQDLSHGFIGWLDWNMALNADSGPSWVHNQYQAAVTVNASSGEFHKNPTFYAMGHFSKFVIPGSLRIPTGGNLPNNIMQIAFLRPDGILAVVIMNSGAQESSITIDIVSPTKTTVVVEPHSINTFLYKL